MSRGVAHERPHQAIFVHCTCGYEKSLPVKVVDDDGTLKVDQVDKARQSAEGRRLARVHYARHSGGTHAIAVN